MDLSAKKRAVAWLSVGSNSLLIVGKVIVGLLIGSVSVISEAIHSGVDLLAALIAVYAVRKSSQPADTDHAFGHGKYENLSGTIEAVLIFGAAAWILYEAVKKLLHPSDIDMPGFGMIVMFVSAVVNWIVSGVLFRVGKQTDSVALQADAWHLRTDVWTSIGVMVGLGLIWIGDGIIGRLNLSPDLKEYWQGLLYKIDPIAAIVVALLIIKAAWELTVQAARDLMDVALPAEEEAWILQTLREFAPAVHGYHRMRTRKAGADRFVEFHIFVDAGMTVQASHNLAHRVSDRIKQHFGQISVLVHVEPCSGKCELCKAKCVLDDPQRAEFRGRQQH